MIFIGIFSFCHGSTHGLEMPDAANPLFFALEFATGTAALLLFGVGIEFYLLKSEPNLWSIEQQKKNDAKGITWVGVRNCQAANNLKQMKKVIFFLSLKY